MVKVQCIKCNREGSLTKKQTKSKGITYVYWYVEHHIGDKIKWCYLGKYEKLSDDYKRLIHKDTQIDTQNPSITTQTESIETHNQRSSEIRFSATSFAQEPVYGFFRISFKYSFHEMPIALFQSSYFWTMLL